MKTTTATKKHNVAKVNSGWKCMLLIKLKYGFVGPSYTRNAECEHNTLVMRLLVKSCINKHWRKSLNYDFFSCFNFTYYCHLCASDLIYCFAWMLISLKLFKLIILSLFSDTNVCWQINRLHIALNASIYDKFTPFFTNLITVAYGDFILFTTHKHASTDVIIKSLNFELSHLNTHAVGTLSEAYNFFAAFESLDRDFLCFSNYLLAQPTIPKSIYVFYTRGAWCVWYRLFELCRFVT